MNETKTSRHFNQRGRPSNKTGYQSEIVRLLTQWRAGGKLSEQAVQILLEKYNIRALKV